MLPTVMILAERLWPKATDIDFELLGKVLADVPEDRAKSILEDARIDSKYNAVPLKDIKSRVRSCGGNSSAGAYIECWAVHQVTKKFYNCCVLAQTDEGARMMMISYLQHRCRVEPTDYTLFIGKESHQGFWDYQHGNINSNPDDEF